MYLVIMNTKGIPKVLVYATTEEVLEEFSPEEYAYSGSIGDAQIQRWTEKRIYVCEAENVLPREKRSYVLVKGD